MAQQPRTVPTIERRLAAIMAADVASYSRLMGVDEVGNLDALKGHQRVPLAHHKGAPV